MNVTGDVIGICGKAGSGKDTIADYLVANYGYISVALADPIKRFLMDVWGYSELTLWGPSSYRNQNHVVVWEDVEEKFEAVAPAFLQELNVDASHLTSIHKWFNEFKALHPEEVSPRQVLQSLGTEWGRETVHPNVWVNYALNKVIKPLLCSTDYLRTIGPMTVNASNVVVTDLRFANEVSFLLDYTPHIIKLNRNTLEVGESNGVTNHKSEKDLEHIDPAVFAYTIGNEGTVEDLYEEVDSIIYQMEGVDYDD